MYRSFLSAGMLAIVLQGNAQAYLHQVLVLNEGYYDFFGGGGQLVPVTLGSYDPVTGNYTTVATIEGPRFGSDVLVDGASIYVAADNKVLRFDADSYALLGEAEVPGVRKLAVWNDQLLITRGELGGLDHYFEARDKNDLGLIYSIDPTEGLPFAAEDVIVVGDEAYLAVGNAFDFNDLQGRIGKVDLVGQSYGDEVDLGSDGRNPEKLMAHDGAIYAFNNKDFTGSSISKVNDAGSLEYTTNVAENSGCAASTRVGNTIYFMEYDQNRLARFDLGSGAVLDTLVESPAVYGLVEDALNGVLYATTTDFFSSGELHVLDQQGLILSSVPVSVSPGNLALDVRTSTGVTERSGAVFGVYPNPAQDRVMLTGDLPTATATVEVLDPLGRVVFSQQRSLAADPSIDIAGWPSGAYSLRIGQGPVVRFTKR